MRRTIRFTDSHVEIRYADGGVDRVPWVDTLLRDGSRWVVFAPRARFAHPRLPRRVWIGGAGRAEAQRRAIASAILGGSRGYTIPMERGLWWVFAVLAVGGLGLMITFGVRCVATLRDGWMSDAMTAGAPASLWVAFVGGALMVMAVLGAMTAPFLASAGIGWVNRRVRSACVNRAGITLFEADGTSTCLPWEALESVHAMWLGFATPGGGRRFLLTVSAELLPVLWALRRYASPGFLEHVKPARSSVRSWVLVNALIVFFVVTAWDMIGWVRAQDMDVPLSEAGLLMVGVGAVTAWTVFWVWARRSGSLGLLGAAQDGWRNGRTAGTGTGLGSNITTEER